MDVIELKLPALEYESRAEKFKKEFFDRGETVINGSALYDRMDFKEWLISTKNNANAQTVSQNWVVATTFFAIRKSDERIIGMIDIRHNLSKDFLAQYGGHIGYAVRPSERRKGYATQMLQLALNYVQSIGLQKVMLGCYSDNAASVKTIVKCSGILTETKPYADGKPMNIYWIVLA